MRPCFSRRKFPLPSEISWGCGFSGGAPLGAWGPFILLVISKAFRFKGLNLLSGGVFSFKRWRPPPHMTLDSMRRPAGVRVVCEKGRNRGVFPSRGRKPGKLAAGPAQTTARPQVQPLPWGLVFQVNIRSARIMVMDGWPVSIIGVAGTSVASPAQRALPRFVYERIPARRRSTASRASGNTG